MQKIEFSKRIWIAEKAKKQEGIAGMVT